MASVAGYIHGHTMSLQWLSALRRTTRRLDEGLNFTVPQGQAIGVPLDTNAHAHAQENDGF